MTTMMVLFTITVWQATSVKAQCIFHFQNPSGYVSMYDRIKSKAKSGKDGEDDDDDEDDDDGEKDEESG